MGIVLAAKAPSDEYPQDRYSEALEHLEKALRTPNAVAQYKKACVLEKMQRYEETLEVLMSLKTAAPKEPSVQLLLGKVYRCVFLLHADRADLKIVYRATRPCKLSCLVWLPGLTRC
jgi:tetratricopeptide (TPR) repeat protein